MKAEIRISLTYGPKPDVQYKVYLLTFDISGLLKVNQKNLIMMKVRPYSITYGLKVSGKRNELIVGIMKEKRRE